MDGYVFALLFVLQSDRDNGSRTIMFSEMRHVLEKGLYGITVRMSRSVLQ